MGVLLLLCTCIGADRRDAPDVVELDTHIVGKPAAIVDAPPALAFESTRGDSFECRVDDRAFAPCETPTALADLSLGPHAFEVRAVDGDEVDETPARAEWTLVQDARHPNLAIVEAGEGWSDDGAGGMWLEEIEWPTQMRPFYEQYPDEYMATVAFTDFPASSSQGVPFSAPLQNDVGGIGAEWSFRQPPGVGDRSGEAGSDGALEVAIFMKGKGYWDAFDWLGIWWEGKIDDVLAQEFGHRWLAYPRLPDPEDRDALLDSYAAHWDFHVALDAPSPMGYWLYPVLDHGDGTFTSELWTGPTEYSSLDLYAMGLLPASEVPDFFWVRGAAPEITREFMTRGQWDFSGERVDVTMDELVESLGPRDPPVGEAPTRFRQAFVLFVRPGESPSEETLDWLDGVRRDWESFFEGATRGLGTVDTALFEGAREESP